MLKKLKLTVPPEMLKAQIKKDPDWFGRVEAARTLCRNGNPSALAAVAEALRKDPFWGARAEMAEALGANGSLRSRDILIVALRTRDDKVWRSVVRALAGFQDDETAEALIPLAKKDPSYFVEGEANASLGATRTAPGLCRPEGERRQRKPPRRGQGGRALRHGRIEGRAGLARSEDLRRSGRSPTGTHGRPSRHGPDGEGTGTLPVRHPRNHRRLSPRFRLLREVRRDSCAGNVAGAGGG